MNISERPQSGIEVLLVTETCLPISWGFVLSMLFVILCTEVGILCCPCSVRSRRIGDILA